MVPVYGSTEGEVEERERFWNDLDWVVDTVGIVYMLCVEGDKNGGFGDILRAGITRGFGVM